MRTLICLLLIASTADAHNVRLRSTLGDRQFYGSGVIVDQRDGVATVATAGHNVVQVQGGSELMDRVEIQPSEDAGWQSCRVVAAEWSRSADAAILSSRAVDGVWPQRLAASPAAVGSRVSLWGCAGSWDERTTIGPVLGHESYDMSIRAHVRRGDSGGAVLNSRGEVVGVISGFVTNDPGITYATRSDRLLAMIEGKPELWVFTMSSCPPCQQFKAHMAADTGSVRTWTHERFAVRWVDVETKTGRALMLQHGVKVVPTFMIHDRKRNPKASGYTSPDPYKRTLTQMIGKLPQGPAPAPPRDGDAVRVPEQPVIDAPLPAAPSEDDSPPPSREPIREAPVPPDVARGSPAPQVGTSHAASDGGATGGAGGIVSWLAVNALPLVLGGGATGGAGLAAWAGVSLARRLLSRKGGGDAAQQAASPRGCPLPRRRVDEAEQLVRLGRIEGRDPLLDATRWMFVEDEIRRQPVEHQAAYRDLVAAVNRRAEQVAPLEYIEHD